VERQTFERSNTATRRAAELHTVASTLLLPIINKAAGSCCFLCCLLQTRDSYAPHRLTN